jgi:hypothetical protein
LNPGSKWLWTDAQSSDHLKGVSLIVYGRVVVTCLAQVQVGTDSASVTWPDDISATTTPIADNVIVEDVTFSLRYGGTAMSTGAAPVA